MDTITGNLAAGLDKLGLETELAAKYAEYIALLAKWNAVYNLTAVRDPLEMVSRHILDSLSVGPYLQGHTVLDVGTGAGLPGIPLALLYPGRQFTLLDTNGKKTRFVQQAVASLGLKNVQVVKSRVEGYRQADGFDTIISRAFASVADFTQQTRHLLAAEGRWLAMKGNVEEAEVGALPRDVALEANHRLTVPGLNAQRCLLALVLTPAPKT